MFFFYILFEKIMLVGKGSHGKKLLYEILLTETLKKKLNPIIADFEIGQGVIAPTGMVAVASLKDNSSSVQENKINSYIDDCISFQVGGYNIRKFYNNIINYIDPLIKKVKDWEKNKSSSENTLNRNSGVIIYSHNSSVS